MFLDKTHRPFDSQEQKYGGDFSQKAQKYAFRHIYKLLPCVKIYLRAFFLFSGEPQIFYKGVFMKKIAGKIAMILILVMLANSFASCTIFAIARGGDADDIVYSILLDLAIAFLAACVYFGTRDSQAEPPGETVIYFASAEYNPLTQYYSVMEILNSLPEKERDSFMERLNSLPETKHADFAETINFLPEAEIDSLTEELKERAKSLPKTEYADTVAFSNHKAFMTLCFQY
jgi:hypothetical protein